MRTAHYWRKAGPKSTPSEIIVFDCETWHGAETEIDGGEWHTLRVGCALAYRLVNGKRTRIQRLTFTDPKQFWTLVESRLDPRRPVWVFGHNIAYDLGIVNGWGFIHSPRYDTHKAAVGAQIFYLKGQVGKATLVFCDTLNYYRCSLAAIGKAIGLAKLPMPRQEDPDAAWVEYCRRDVDVTAGGVDALIQFVRDGELGPWQPSIAGLSFSAFRACFMESKVLVHSYRSILALERGGYYGGIVDCPFIGRVPASPVHELDVSSMYPAVCRNDLPTRYVKSSGRVGKKALAALVDRFMVVADVSLKSPDTPYPMRQKKGTYFPVGEFRTTLAHPELVEALESGHIDYIHQAAWYERAPLFRDYMEHFTNLKAAYRKEGNEAFATICKYYGNSLYGKTGQLSPTWREWGRESLTVLEEDHELYEGALENWYDKPPSLYEPTETFRFPMIGEPLEVRDLWGIVEIKVGETESRESCPIIAATVTSYARVLLRKFQKIAGAGHWFYSDTDSIWVDDRGRDNLDRADCIRDDELGFLSDKSSHEWMLVFGPKDYETPSVRRVKGVRMSAEPIRGGGWSQLHFPSALTQMKDGRTGGVFVRENVKFLKRQLTKSKVLRDGRTRPLIFPQENPEGGR